MRFSGSVNPFVRPGFTLAFSLLAAAICRADLPAGYEALDGIASTSSGKQYILTDYVPSSCNVKIEATVTLTKWATQGIWCSRVGMSDRTMTLFCWASGDYFRLDRNANTGTYAKKGPVLNTKAVLVGDYGTRTFSVDGSASANLMASGDFTPASQLGFFASHTNGSGWGNYAVMTLHGVKVYDANGALEREYVPARSEANKGKATEYGLYETQEGKYFSVGGSTAFTPVQAAAVSWTEDAAADALVLTVAGVYQLTDDDAARITSTTHANLVKRGSGKVVGTPIQAFTGNLTIEEGTYCLSHQYDCGADNVGWIRVCDGATLEFSGFSGNAPRALTGKTIYTTGNGVGGIGAIYGGCSWNSCSKCRFILEGDSYYQATGEFNFIDYIDLAGHKLKGRQATTNTRWGLSGNTITNSVPESPATFDFVGGMMRPETMSYFRGKASDGVVKIRSDTTATTLVNATVGLTSVWPVEVGPNVKYSAQKLGTNHADVANGVLSGPLTFTGKVKLATDVNSGLPSLANVKGTLTGSGTTDIGAGWVNYHTTANDYAGTVTVASSNVLAQAGYRAGIGVRAGAVYSAAATTFENADLDLTGGDVSTVRGPILFTGDDQSRLTGGNFTGERTKLALVRKEGGGELLLSGAVAITGRLEVAAGRVRLPSRTEYMPVVGKVGLMGSATNAYESGFEFSSPDSGSIPCVYDTLYGRGTDLTSRWDGKAVKGPRTTMVRGYVWNRTDSDVTWTFKANNQVRLWLWLDGEAVFTRQNCSDDALATRTLTPGAHSIAIITAVDRYNTGPNYVKWVSGLGSLYDALPVDFQGRGVWTATNFSPFIDPGDGSLFTVDDTRTEDLTDPFWLATVDTMAFAPGAELDLGGYDYCVGNLEGAPKVTNVVTLTVSRSWKLDSAMLAAESPLEVTGSLMFGAGAQLDLVDGLDLQPLAVLEALDRGVTIASVAGTLNAAELTLAPTLQAAGATLMTGEGGKSLVLTVPATRYMRVTETGLDLGYAVSEGAPRKEVRLDVYRDGVLVAQNFVGDGYRSAGEWSYAGAGYYVVKVTRTALASADPDETETVTDRFTFGQKMVAGGGAVRYVSPVDTAGEYTSVRDAIDSLGAAGGRVYVRPGRYEEVFGGTPEAPITNGVELATAVQVIGLTDDPADVVVTRKDGNRMRIFQLNHAEAAIRFLTVEGGYQYANDYLLGNGGNVFVNTKGGTVENCVIRNGSTIGSWPGGGGNVALFNGTLRNCVLIGGVNSTDTTNMWVNCGGSLLLYQRSGCAPVAENCLITGCVSADRSGSAPIGLYGDAKLVNCTVVSNASNISGGMMISKLNGKLPQVVNCAFYDNTIRATPASDAQVVYGIVQTYRNKAANTPTAADAAVCFVNCALPVGLNATCVETTEPGFADAAHGDYTLTADSPLVNAGYDTSTREGVGLFDLLGSPRFVKRVDIGCYEYRVPKFAKKGNVILIR